MSKRGPRVAGAVVLFAVAFFSLLVARRSQTPVVPDNAAGPRPRPAVGVRRAPDGPGSPLQIIPEGSPLRDGAGIEVASRDVLVESRGSYAYHGDSYSISLHADSVRWQSDSAELDLGFHEARLGDAVLSKGGEGAPLPLPLERTVTYDRGIVQERYLFRQEGVEQSFVLSQAPSGGGDLTVATSISSDLTPPAEGTVSRRLSFSRDGREVAFITRAEAFDHRGRSLPLELSWKEGMASMTVPSSWLAEAEFPVTVDPIIGAPTTIRSTTAAFKGSDVAYNSAANEWLAVWSEPSATLGSDIWTQRVAASGSLVGTPVNLGVASYTHFLPTVSYCAKVNRYLVTWGAYFNFVSPSLYRIYGAVLNADGSVFAPTFVVKQLGANAIDVVRMACDDTNWYVCWGQKTTSIYPSQFTIGGNFISTAGVPGAYVPADTDPSPSAQSTPTVAFMNGTYVLSWIKNGQLVARTMSPTGGFTPVTVVDAGSDSAPNIAASSGQSFLLTWTSAASTSTGRLYTLNARVLNSGLGSATGTFPVRSQLPSAPSVAASAFSVADGVWTTAYTYDELGTGKAQVLSETVSPIGNVRMYETMSDGSATAGAPRVAWNSATDTTLVVYPSTGSTGNTLVGLRAGPSGLPPSAPTGLIATPADSQVLLQWAPVAGATGYSLYRTPTSGGPYDRLATVVTSSYTDSAGLVNGTLYYYVVIAFNYAGPGPSTLEVPCTPRAGSAPQVLFVAGTVPPSNDDAAIVNELQNGLGYSVAVHADSGILSSDIAGKALAVISSTVNADNVNWAFSGSTLPILVCSPGMMQTYLSMTSSSGAAALQSVVVMNAANASHPLSAGLAGSPPVVGTPETFSWGVPYGTATIIATLSGNSSEAAVFAYEPGVLSPGNLAPARRVGFFLGSGAAPVLSTAGRTLLDAAVRYAAGVPDAPLTLDVQAEKGMMTLQWAASAGATSYRIFRSTQGGAFNQIASGVSGTTFVDTGLAVGQTYSYTVVAVSPAGASLQSQAAGQLVQNNTAVVDVGGTVSVVPVNPSLPSPYTSGSLDAFVAKSVMGVAQALSVDQTTLASGRWAVSSGPLSITGQTATHCDFATTSQKEGAGAITYMATLSTGETATRNYWIKIRYVKEVKVKFHFPEDNPGRTTRTGYGDFWAPDNAAMTPPYTTRYTNRANFVNAFTPLVEAILKHTGIKLAPYVDEKLMGSIGCTGGTFNATNSTYDKWTSTALGMYGKYKDDLGEVHIYLVSSVNSGGLGGVTMAGPLDSGWSASIWLGDVDTTGSVLAHELGHVLSLPDYKDRTGANIPGVINNHTKTSPWSPSTNPFGPLQFLLMKWQMPLGAWLTDSDAWKARAAADSRKINYN